MDEYDFEERRYKNRRRDFEYEDYREENEDKKIGVGYISNMRYQRGDEEKENDIEEDENSEIKVKTKKNLNILIVVQIISCLTITLTVLILKYFGGTYYNIFYNWYTNEIGKSIIAGENVEKYINTFGVKLDKVKEEAVKVTTENINGVKKEIDFKILNPIEDGVVTSEFGERRGSFKHKGIDIAASENTNIVSVLNGVVSQVSEDKSYGKYVVIDHGNSIKTKYAHCNEILAVNGSEVSQGSNIALVGNTGDSTGNHLHLELIIDGEYYNPKPLFYNEYNVC